MASGARIDVRAGESGRAGRVSFTAARNENNDGLAADLRGTVLSQRRPTDAAGEVSIEARRVYQAADTSDIAAYEVDHKDFMTRVRQCGDQGWPEGRRWQPAGQRPCAWRGRGAVER